MSPDPQFASSSAPRRPTLSFLLSHPAHFMALGAGSGLSPIAPGTAGTLWAWLCFDWASKSISASAWAWILLIGLGLGWWACTVAAQHLNIPDPSAVVWDEIIAFWLILWILAPATWWTQCVAFMLFRYFDAAKPGPVGWADQVCKRPVVPGEPPRIGALEGWGIIFDDLVAAGLTLLTMALWQWGTT